MRPIRRLAVGLASVGVLSVGMALPAAALPTGSLINGGDRSLCLGIQNSGVGSDNAVLGGCSRSPTQTWRVRATTVVGTWFGYQFENGANQCLGVTGGSTASGARVVQGPCGAVSDHSQIWRPAQHVQPMIVGYHTDPGPGPYWLVNGHSGLCLGVTTGGTTAIQGTCNTSSVTQAWVIGSP